MKKYAGNFIKIFLILVVLLCLWVGYNTFPIWRNYVEGPPVNFVQNEDVSLGLYPEGKQSAVVFTNDDICAVTPFESIERLRNRLKKLKLKGTFFVIPFHYGRSKLETGLPQVGLVKELGEDGHEIAQHGFLHYCGRNELCGVGEGFEMLLLDREEQKERLSRGRAILEELGFHPVGHRSPCFSGTEETFRALDELNYLYGSDLHLPPTTPRTLLLGGFRGNIMYPYHPEEMNLLQVTSHCDPTEKWDKAVGIFDRFHRRGGVFVILTHLPTLAAEENLDRLEKFMEYVTSRDTWLCRLDELCRWWLVREKIEIATEKTGDTLVITCENPSNSTLKNADIFFKETDPALKKYQVVSRKGKLIKKGSIPATRRILIDLPSDAQERSL